MSRLKVYRESDADIVVSGRNGSNSAVNGFYRYFHDDTNPYYQKLGLLDADKDFYLQWNPEFNRWQISSETKCTTSGVYMQAFDLAKTPDKVKRWTVYDANHDKNLIDLRISVKSINPRKKLRMRPDHDSFSIGESSILAHTMIAKDAYVQDLVKKIAELQKKVAVANKKAEVANNLFEGQRMALKQVNAKAESQKEKYENATGRNNLLVKTLREQCVRMELEKFRCGICGLLEDPMYQCPCEMMHYCSKKCQKYGWRRHRELCSFREQSLGTDINTCEPCID